MAGEGWRDFPAEVSPDGRSLLVLSAFALPEGKSSDRFALVELDSAADPKLVGPEGASLRNPSWSPDGRWLAYESDASSFRDIYRLELASGATLRLTNDPQGNFEPAISPEGGRIAFVSSRDGNAEIYVMSADGGDPRRLTRSKGDDSEPAWSPDGARLAFLSARDRARGIDVFVMGAEGEDPKPLLANAREGGIIASDLAWSPDGTRLAFAELASKGKGGAVVIVDVEHGTEIVRTSTGKVDEQPVWSSDGHHVAFSSGHQDHVRIMRMTVEGGAVEALTAEGLHWLPRWIADSHCPHAAPLRAPRAVSDQG
nr:LpqB family beta-propeller domain-containing protein [Pseudenhygromyxa sp. WMMC2535]